MSEPPPGSDRRAFMVRSAMAVAIDLDSTVHALALTAKEMNSKYKGTSEGGLAVSLTLC